MMIGYNINGFDFDFMFDRSKELECSEEFLKLSYNKNEICYNQDWKTGKYDIEKSKTLFNRFIYSIENKDIEMLMMDKEHFNTLELLKNDNKEFYYHGHNRIYQYLLTLIIKNRITVFMCIILAKFVKHRRRNDRPQLLYFTITVVYWSFLYYRRR